MKRAVSILCSDPAHPVNPWLERWARRHAREADVRIVRRVAELDRGELLFLVSCHEIVRAPVRERFARTFVLHASALPEGRGMSPHVWQILAGARSLTLTLLAAADGVDTGDVWRQAAIALDGTELHDEIHAKLFSAELALMTWAMRHAARAAPRPQTGTPTTWRRRTPEDSRVDPSRPLAEAFDLLRVADPDRYPAFFEHRGRRYRLRIERMDDHP